MCDSANEATKDAIVKVVLHTYGWVGLILLNYDTVCSEVDVSDDIKDAVARVLSIFGAVEVCTVTRASSPERDGIARYDVVTPPQQICCGLCWIRHKDGVEDEVR